MNDGIHERSRMNRIPAVSLIALCSALAQPALAATLTVNGITSDGYSAFVQVGAQRFDVPDAEFIVFEASPGKQAVGFNFFVFDAAFDVSMNGILNPDPGISWGLSVTNASGGPLGLTFGYTTPLLPAVSFPSLFGVSSQISGGITDTGRATVTDATGDGVSLAPLAGSGFVQNPALQAALAGPSTAASVPSGSGFVRGATGSTNPTTYDYTLFSSGPASGPTGTWNFFSTEIAFSLSGNGDIASLTGNAIIGEVPLPAAAWLMIGGLFGLVGVARRKPLAA
jgi:hypothetical protein